MKIVFGLIGVKTSGKSTAAGILEDLIPNLKEISLANKLKDTCSKVFSIPRDYFDLHEFKEKRLETPARLTVDNIQKILKSFNISNAVLNDRLIDRSLTTPRLVAQVVGTELLRNAGGQDIHCLNLDVRHNSVISDIRFLNELNFFADRKDIRFIPIYIQNYTAERKITEESHRSEKEIFEIIQKEVYKVDNNGSALHTKYQLLEILKKESIC